MRGHPLRGPAAGLSGKFDRLHAKRCDLLLGGLLDLEGPRDNPAGEVVATRLSGLPALIPTARRAMFVPRVVKSILVPGFASFDDGVADRVPDDQPMGRVATAPVLDGLPFDRDEILRDHAFTARRRCEDRHHNPVKVLE